jgi:hypothetical protein
MGFIDQAFERIDPTDKDFWLYEAGKLYDPTNPNAVTRGSTKGVEGLYDEGVAKNAHDPTAAKSPYHKGLEDGAKDASPIDSDRDKTLELIAGYIDYVKGLNQPMIDMRNSALGELAKLQANPNMIKLMPGYNEGLTEGIRAVDASASANNSLMSGAHQKRLVRFGGDYFNQKYGEQYNRILALLGLGTTVSGQNIQGVGTGTGFGANAYGQHSGDWTSYINNQTNAQVSADNNRRDNATARRGQNFDLIGSILPDINYTPG